MAKKYKRPDGPMRCVVYARYSSSNQREISAEEQVRYCKEFIDAHGYIFIDEYVDKETTGTNANRKRFQDMLYDSKSHKFDIVVVYKNDRFARDVYDKVVSKRILANNGVTINYVKEDILNGDGPETIIYESISDAMAAYYSMNLAREVMEKGHLPNAAQSKHNGGTPPLGLDVINGKYVVNEAEARIVRMIFDWYVNRGYGYTKIAEELNKMGYLNKRGKPFVPSSIREMLINEKYIGTYVYNRRAHADAEGKHNNNLEKDPNEQIKNLNAFPAIIDAETFGKVKACMESRKGRNATNQAKEPYYLSGLIKCGQCGGNMSGNRKGHNRNGTPQAEYRCNCRDKKGLRVCNTKGINKHYIEAAVEHYISTLCCGENFNQVMRALQDYAKTQANTDMEQDQVSKELRKVEKQIANIVSAIAGGFDAEELKERYDVLKGQKRHLQTELCVLQQKAADRIDFDEADVLKALQNLRASVTNCRSEEELKMLYNKFIDSIEVKEGYVTIALNILKILGYHRKVYVLSHEKKPPLDLHQMVAWNGGGKGSVYEPLRDFGIRGLSLRNFEGDGVLLAGIIVVYSYFIVPEVHGLDKGADQLCLVGLVLYITLSQFFQRVDDPLFLNGLVCAPGNHQGFFEGGYFFFQLQ